MGDGNGEKKASSSSTPSWTKPATAARRRSSSLTAALLASSLIVLYALALGTQFRMMGILVDTHASSSLSTGGHHVTTVALGKNRPPPPSSPSSSSPSSGGSTAGGKKKKKREEEESGTTAARIASGRSGRVGVGRGKEARREEGARRPRPGTKTAAEDSPAPTTTAAAMAKSIAQRWNLTTPHAASLLERQFEREDDYDPRGDFVHFHHLYKSGGTSISSLMDKTLGSIDGGILPGSYESGNFDHEEALADINRRIASGTRREDLPYAASYAHTGLRPVHGPRRTRTGIFLLDQLPQKRLRVITMLRDVVDFRASNHAMIMCGLNYEVTRWNNEREARGLPRVCSPRDGLNISAMVDRKIRDLMDRCRAEDDILARGERPERKLFPAQRKTCRDEESGIDTLAHCRSAEHLLASPQYDKHYRSMFKALMGRFHRGQEFTNGEYVIGALSIDVVFFASKNIFFSMGSTIFVSVMADTAYKGMGYGFERAEESRGYSIEKVEEYTLQDLGGLDPTISGAGDGVGPPEPDFVWFGITERMKVSSVTFDRQCV
jgi:hypothetical protein